jgi:hypothetical protein
MSRVVTHALLILATLTPARLRAAETPEADLATGIRQVQEGDFETAVVTLQGVTRKLQGQTTRRQELAQAHLYLGIAHVALDQPAEAKTAFKAALTQNKELRLTPDRFSPKVIAAFEEARREAEAAASAGGTSPAEGSGKPLLWVAVGGAAAGAVVLATRGRGDGAVNWTNARFTTPVVVCENGSVNVPLEYSVLVDVDNRTSRQLSIQAVDMFAVIVESPAAPGEVGFNSHEAATVAPTTVGAESRATLRVVSTILCGNGPGDPARHNVWTARISFSTSAGMFHVEAAGPMRVDIP